MTCITVFAWLLGHFYCGVGCFDASTHCNIVLIGSFFTAIVPVIQLEMLVVPSLSYSLSLLTPHSCACGILSQLVETALMVLANPRFHHGASQFVVVLGQSEEVSHGKTMGIVRFLMSIVHIFDVHNYKLHRDWWHRLRYAVAILVYYLVPGTTPTLFPSHAM